MSEIIEMPYGDSKALTREFIKAYTEIQLDVEIEERNNDDGKGIFEKYQVSGSCDKRQAGGIGQIKA